MILCSMPGDNIQWPGVSTAIAVLVFCLFLLRCLRVVCCLSCNEIGGKTTSAKTLCECLSLHPVAEPQSSIVLVQQAPASNLYFDGEFAAAGTNSPKCTSITLCFDDRGRSPETSSPTTESLGVAATYARTKLLPLSEI